MTSTRAIVAAVLALPLVTGSAAILPPAFAHAHATLTLEDEPVAGKQISVVLGHENEPTYGAKAGIHDGKHGLEIIISDEATSLPLTGASLKADKYYFRDIKSFEKADSPEDADAIVKGVDVRGVFGEAGNYLARQVQKPGIYGYKVYGTIDYFGVPSISIDTTVFCSSPEGDATKFNSPEWSGSFGYTSDINDSTFPGRIARSTTQSTASEAKGEIVAASAKYEVTKTEEPQSWDYGTLLFGIPIAVLAGVLGWRSLRKQNGQ
jgi:hypothetical protein